MTYRLGRWFRRLVRPVDLNETYPPPADIGNFLGNATWDGLILAPLLKQWFIYRPESGEQSVPAPNYTCSDIRWFVGNWIRFANEPETRVSVREDRYLMWSNRVEMVGPTTVPVRADPHEEWIVYTTWVRFVRSRTPSAKKSGKIRRGYHAWFRSNFEGMEDPLGLVCK